MAMAINSSNSTGRDARATERFREAYTEEAAELLSALEASLLELENRPADSELIAQVFRALHTIKGSGAMFGFEAIASFTHELETVFDDVRFGRIAATPELIGVTLHARDHIQNLLGASKEEEAALAAAGEEILAHLREAAGGEQEASKPLAQRPVEPEAESDQTQDDPATYRIGFEPSENILLSGNNPVRLFKELKALGVCSVVAHSDRVPEITELDPEKCSLHWDAVLTTTADENAIRDVFIFVEDLAEIKVQRLEQANLDRRLRLGEILVDRGDAQFEAVEECLSGRPLAGELLVQAGLVQPEQVSAAMLEQRHLDTAQTKRQKPEAAASLRVPAAKLDSLVDIVGELVTVQARLSGYALASSDSEVHFIAEEVERLTEMLRDNTMGLRMLPIGETFSRFKRLVRDLSTDLGKDVELTTEGNDTELDKTVIEQLSDPLVHLIRNAADHGIEPPDVRIARGKPAKGKIHLSACHSGAAVLIRVSDDGAGMNREAIRKRAIERALIQPDAVLSDDQIFALTMKPGFSTASTVTAVSGRGVGLDVVQRSIDSLRGTISVTSEAGRGSTITLKIPLTLAIIDGLLVEAGGAFFVVPLSNISECIELVRDAGEKSRGRALANVRNELVPYVVLRNRFRLPGEPPKIEQVIIAETRDGRFGFVVDRVIGDHHTVIKKLGGLYRHVDEVSGATILGDGTVALILDVDRIAGDVIRGSAYPGAAETQHFSRNSR